MRYEVDETDDNTDSLRDTLSVIAAKNGRVISVMWVPPHEHNFGTSTADILGGYTVVSAYDA